MENDDLLAASRSRYISFPGRFVPVSHFCRAPLGNGKLCQRQDRVKVANHGAHLRPSESLLLFPQNAVSCLLFLSVLSTAASSPETMRVSRSERRTSRGRSRWRGRGGSSSLVRGEMKRNKCSSGVPHLIHSSDFLTFNVPQALLDVL